MTLSLWYLLFFSSHFCSSFISFKVHSPTNYKILLLTFTLQEGWNASNIACFVFLYKKLNIKHLINQHSLKSVKVTKGLLEQKLILRITAPVFILQLDYKRKIMSTRTESFTSLSRSFYNHAFSGGICDELFDPRMCSHLQSPSQNQYLVKEKAGTISYINCINNQLPYSHGRLSNIKKFNLFSIFALSSTILISSIAPFAKKQIQGI